MRVRPKGMSAKPVLRLLYEYLAFYGALGLFAIACMLWVPLAALLSALLPRRYGGTLGRAVVSGGFQGYLRMLAFIGACRFDLGALDALRGQPATIIAPNHPCLLDAVLVLSRLRNVVCVMKAALGRNVLLGLGARLAGYIRNDSTVMMVNRAVDSLRQGNHLLVFPEGTRTTRLPVSAFTGGLGFMARRAGVAVQTVFIETDSGYLSKGWPPFRKPALPVTYRIRLGRRFEPLQDVRLFRENLERYFAEELAHRTPLPQWPPAA